jgi:hypothetical protein
MAAQHGLDLPRRAVGAEADQPGPQRTAARQLERRREIAHDLDALPGRLGHTLAMAGQDARVGEFEAAAVDARRGGNATLDVAPASPGGGLMNSWGSSRSCATCCTACCRRCSSSACGASGAASAAPSASIAASRAASSRAKCRGVEADAALGAVGARTGVGPGPLGDLQHLGRSFANGGTRVAFGLQHAGDRGIES